jgi:hypothetical protein
LRSRILSLISVAALGACSSPDTCGTTGGSEFGLEAASTTDAVDLIYGDLVASQNNDCPASGAPAGVVSLTITGMEMGTTGFITLCVPRPDTLETTPGMLGTDVVVIDFTGADDTCSYTLDMTGAPTGTVTSHGMCGDGSDSAGFALEFDGTISLGRACGTTIDTVSVSVSGDVDVSAGS